MLRGLSGNVALGLVKKVGAELRKGIQSSALDLATYVVGLQVRGRNGSRLVGIVGQGSAVQRRACLSECE